MHQIPTTLVLFDIDHALYNAPGLHPDLERSIDEDAFYSPQSFGSFGEPGFDHRWNLQTVIAARRALQSDDSYVVLLSHRPMHTEMLHTISNMLLLAGLKFHEIRLKPITLHADTHLFKAMAIRKLLLEHQNIRHVVMHDGDQDSMDAVANAVGQMGRDFTPSRVDGPT